MDRNVYVDPALQKGEALQTVYFVKELENGWVLQSVSPQTNNIDEYEKIEQAEALKLYPELKELFDLSPDRNVSFRKGINSGKWYDFL